MSSFNIISPIIQESSSWGAEDPDFSRIYTLAKELVKYLDKDEATKVKADFAADRILDKLETALAHYQKIQSDAFSKFNISQQRAEYEGLYNDLWSAYKDRLQVYLKNCGVDIGFFFQDDKKFEEGSKAFIAENSANDNFVKFANKQRTEWQNDFGLNRDAHQHNGDLRNNIKDYDNPGEAKRLFAQVCWTAETMIGVLVSWKLRPEWNVIDTDPKSTVFDRKERFIVEHAIVTRQRSQIETRK